MREQAIVFGCEDEQLLGVFSSPPACAAETGIGVIVIVGGPQYRAGSHRQFVHLARTLAAAGHPVLRFDVRGMGDSSGAMQSFETLDEDIGCAIDEFLRVCPALEGVALWGLCDGASAALLYQQRRADHRVKGLALANPWVRSAQSQSHTLVRHYYLDRLRQPAFWRKLLTGKIAASAISGLLGHARAALATGQAADDMSYVTRMAAAWQDFAGPLLLLLSGKDFVAKEFLHACEKQPAWRGALQNRQLTRIDFHEADHTFSGPGQKDAVSQATLRWLRDCAGT